MKKVLIVDDDPSILKIASMRLRAEAVEVMAAGDGAEGLRMSRGSSSSAFAPGLDAQGPRVQRSTGGPERFVNSRDGNPDYLGQGDIPPV